MHTPQVRLPLGVPPPPTQVVAPKRAALAEAEAAYAAVLSGLQAKQAELAELEARLAGLEARLAESQERKQRLEVGRCACDAWALRVLHLSPACRTVQFYPRKATQSVVRLLRRAAPCFPHLPTRRPRPPPARSSWSVPSSCWGAWAGSASAGRRLRGGCGPPWAG